MNIRPSHLQHGMITSDVIERIKGPFPAPKFTFIYRGDTHPVREGKMFWVVIDKEKYSTQSFVNFIQKFASANQKISVDQIEELLSLYEFTSFEKYLKN